MRENGTAVDGYPIGDDISDIHDEGDDSEDEVSGSEEEQDSPEEEQGNQTPATHHQFPMVSPSSVESTASIETVRPVNAAQGRFSIPS